jgi:ectoine hydroxylase-related dioxygenase (phytanoyl-CoA dioxygenase family)
MLKTRQEFFQKDYVLLKKPLSSSVMNLLYDEYAELIKRANHILKYATEKNIPLNEFYKNNLTELIVVPEAADCFNVCRFEYIAGFSKNINTYVVSKIRELINNLMGKSFVLFKDKCNVKSPGGGAFPPHQDISAYYHFKPRFYLTAAIMLDDSNIENGCLEMATGYKNDTYEKSSYINSEYGNFPFFDFYRGGNRNGDIKDEISSKFNWEIIEANKGDIIIFNAFVPHRSKNNISHNQRRNIFFTFNPESEGNFYQEYYNLKRTDFGNPMFHVSTPTLHND